MDKKNPLIKDILPGLRDALFISIFFAALFLGPRMLNIDGDLPKHLTIGKYILDGNYPPVYDVFSHTRYGVPFAPHKWLSGVFFYIAYILLEEKGIIILSGVLLATTFVLIYSDSAARTKIRLPLFFLVAWGAAVSSLHWISRPHLFTMLLLAIWLIWNEKLASGKKIPLWYFPALMLIWNNVHGEFISGILITSACLAGWIWDYLFNRPQSNLETGKRIGLVLLMVIIVSILNPVSFRAWSTVTSWIGNDYLMSHTQETVPPDFSQGKYFILLGFLAFSLFLLAMKRDKLPTRLAFILAGFTGLTMLSARNVHLYGVVAPFVLAGTLKGMLANPLVRWSEDLFAKFESKFIGIIWPLLSVIFGIFLLVSTPIGQETRFSPDYFPVQAVDWLKTHPQDGEMFNTFDWGGYISFMLWPENRVFIDSQGDVYGETFLREYEHVITLGNGWQDVLKKYHVEWALIPRDWQLANALKNEDWIEVYIDPTSIILRRSK